MKTLIKKYDFLIYTSAFMVPVIIAAIFIIIRNAQIW